MSKSKVENRLEKLEDKYSTSDNNNGEEKIDSVIKLKEGHELDGETDGESEKSDLERKIDKLIQFHKES